MDFDEFQESDLMFSDYSSDQSSESNDKDENQSSNEYEMMTKMSRKATVNKKRPSRRAFSSSVPVDVPRNNSFRCDIGVVGFELFDEDLDAEYYEDTTMGLPPHVIVERRLNGEMARSFSPLKDKNLSEVRNSILRMTGFLER